MTAIIIALSMKRLRRRAFHIFFCISCSITYKFPLPQDVSEKNFYINGIKAEETEYFVETKDYDIKKEMLFLHQLPFKIC